MVVWENTEGGASHAAASWIRCNGLMMHRWGAIVQSSNLEITRDWTSNRVTFVDKRLDPPDVVKEKLAWPSQFSHVRQEECPELPWGCMIWILSREIIRSWLGDASPGMYSCSVFLEFTCSWWATIHDRMPPRHAVCQSEERRGCPQHSRGIKSDMRIWPHWEIVYRGRTEQNSAWAFLCGVDVDPLSLDIIVLSGKKQATTTICHEFQGSSRFVSYAFMLWISCSSTSWDSYLVTGLNILSCSWNQYEMTCSLWRGALSCWKKPL